MDELEIFKLYKRRWLMLTIFCLTSAICASHWLQYSIIANIITKYYGVSERAVDWTTLIHMAVYIVLFVPINWFIEKKGLRMSVLYGLFFFTSGSWLKLFSLERSTFIIAFLSQVVISCGRVFILSVPPRLASIWFGSSEVSTACAIGVFGEQLGIAITFLVPPMVVHAKQDLSSIREDLKTLHIGMAGATTFLHVLGLFLFEDEPPTPPSIARRYSLGEERRRIIYNENLVLLLRNKNFFFLMISFGLSAGVMYAYVILLNQLFVDNNIDSTTDADDLAGYTGLTFVAGGFVGSVIWGILLDRTHQYKLIALSIYAMSIVAMVLFKVFYHHKLISLVYTMSAFLGAFLIGYIPVAYEFAVELTFPIPECTSAGLIIAVNQASGLAIILTLSYTLVNYTDFVIYAVLSGILAFGLVVGFFISGRELHRLSAQLM